MKALWCESCGFERNNNVLTSSPPHPKGMVRLVEASVSVGWLLRTSWLVACHTAYNDCLVSCQGGQKSATAKNHLSTPMVNRYCLKHEVIMLAWRFSYQYICNHSSIGNTCHYCVMCNLEDLFLLNYILIAYVASTLTILLVYYTTRTEHHMSWLCRPPCHWWINFIFVCTSIGLDQKVIQNAFKF